MKTKTISAVLEKKFDAWKDSIEDDGIRKVVDQTSIITGGSIVSMLLNEIVSDFDIYFTTADTAEIVASYYVDQFKKNPPARFRDADKKVGVWVERHNERIKVVVKNAGVVGEEGGDYAYFEGDENPEYQEAFLDAAIKTAEDDADNTKKKYRPTYLSANAISLSDRVQLVIRFTGNADLIHQNYDFVHCTNYWESSTRKLVLRKEALESILTRTLVYQGSKYPICSLFRLRKFLERGWTINAGQILKIALQVADLNLSDLNVLEDQLTGVDVAYFLQIVELLKNKDPQAVDRAYLVSLLDRLF